MNSIPPKLRAELSADPFYRVCARHGPDCDGRVTWEHALMYAGKQIQAKFAIIPLCEFHHGVGVHQDGGALNKRWNIDFAMRRATPEDRERYPRLPWHRYPQI